jgi:hypothetical protein
MSKVISKTIVTTTTALAEDAEMAIHLALVAGTIWIEPIQVLPTVIN